MKKIKSYAKVNLFLKVTKQLKNFYKLHSLIVQINLYDEILIKENSKKKTLYSSLVNIKLIHKIIL